MIITEKKRRGRKPKVELVNNLSVENENIDNVDNTNITIEVENIKIPKKRGRKPKGGKIIENSSQTKQVENIKPNIILHLKCNSEDLNNEPNNSYIETYMFNDSKTNNLQYNYIQYNNAEKNLKDIPKLEKEEEEEEQQETSSEYNKEIHKKLKELSIQLHTNNIPDKKSSCFWCTYSFDSPPIFIPKYEINNSYFVYGCFCSCECACAYLMQENIDQATKMERYALLNFIYGKLYNYEKNIKPAPNPYYTLDKYYGNLSIQQYRKLLTTERLLLIVDKPLCRQLPELHEDNDDLLLNNKIGNITSRYKIKKSQTIQTKSSIMQEQFNII